MTAKKWRNVLSPQCIKRGGKAYRQHQTLKDFIRKRDNYTCQLCGATIDEVKQMDVDHIIPWHISHDSSIANLRVLCHRCNLIGRRYTLPKGKHRSLPLADWYQKIQQELKFS